jgi:hypothetical protein
MFLRQYFGCRPKRRTTKWASLISFIRKPKTQHPHNDHATNGLDAEVYIKIHRLVKRAEALIAHTEVVVTATDLSNVSQPTSIHEHYSLTQIRLPATSNSDQVNFNSTESIELIRLKKRRSRMENYLQDTRMNIERHEVLEKQHRYVQQQIEEMEGRLQ